MKCEAKMRLKQMTQNSSVFPKGLKKKEASVFISDKRVQAGLFYFYRRLVILGHVWKKKCKRVFWLFWLQARGTD